jgi:hypothetical protein
MRLYQLEEAGCQIVFVNGFAANDPDSTGRIWEMIVRRYARLDRHIALVNCRADRPDRSVQLAEAALTWQADHYIVTGSAPDIFIRRALAVGIEPQLMTTVESGGTGRLVQTMARHAGRSAMVMGIGNIAGPGMDLLHYLDQRNGAPRQPRALKEAA